MMQFSPLMHPYLFTVMKGMSEWARARGELSSGTLLALKGHEVVPLEAPKFTFVFVMDMRGLWKPPNGTGFGDGRGGDVTV